VSDLERAIARLHASTVAGASGRDAANVVLYEDGAKRKVRQLLAALRDMQAVHAALEAFRDTEEAVGSEALLALVGPGRWQELGASLQELLEATDWQQAEETGRVIPAKVGSWLM
jgi:DNA mismatch repair protein MSH6